MLTYWNTYADSPESETMSMSEFQSNSDIRAEAENRIAAHFPIYF